VRNHGRFAAIQPIANPVDAAGGTGADDSLSKRVAAHLRRVIALPGLNEKRSVENQTERFAVFLNFILVEF